MNSIKAGTLLYRGIDCAPQQVDPILRLNTSEEILWLADSALVAQTYIPSVGSRVGLALPSETDLDNSPRPDDGIVDKIARACGGEFTVFERYNKLSETQEVDPHFSVPNYLRTGNTWGRPTSWKWTKEVTWRQIIAHLETLGYDTTNKDRVLWINTTGLTDKLLPKWHRLRGSLAIIKVTEDLLGLDHSTGQPDHLDPAYRKAAKLAGAALRSGRDYVYIDDLAQTERWGNVGHRSIAVNERGIKKIEVHALIPAFHREWSDNFVTDPTIEERAWRRGLIRSQHYFIKAA